MYIDKKKTVAEGRKVKQEYCVEYPQMAELRDVLDHLGFEHAYEVSASGRRRGCPVPHAHEHIAPSRVPSGKQGLSA